MELDWTCAQKSPSERRGTMTAWWGWSGSLKEEGNWDNQRSLGEEQWKRSADRRGGPAGPKLGAWHKTGIIGEQELQPYVPQGRERTKC